MKLLSLVSLALILGLLNHVAASSAITTKKCYTQQGSKPVKHVATSYSTTTIRVPANTVYSTAHSTSTFTPAPKTTTQTATLTTTAIVTDTAVTDTFSTTSTVHFTVTETNIATEMATATTTASATTLTTTTTSTVAAPAGFTPIQSSTASPSPAPGGAARRNNLVSARIAARLDRQSQQGGEGGCRGKSYPQSVKCNVQVIVKPDPVIKTIKGKPTTVTLAPKTKTSTITTTSTSTLTSVPNDVSTTLKFSITQTDTTTLSSTITSTATTTSTETVTSTAVATFLAACSPNNYVEVYDIYNRVGSGTPHSSYTLSSASNAYDCCSQCQAMTTCSGSGYATSGNCFLFQDNMCPANGASNGVAGYYVGTNGFQASNGPCYTYYFQPYLGDE